MADRLFSGASPETVKADLAPLVDFQEQGLHIADLNMLVEERLLPHLMRYDLPACQGLFNSALEEGAAYGAEVALEWNQGVTTWQASPGGSVLEELCCEALCRLFKLGPEAEATLFYCGDYANHQALFMALHHWASKSGFDYSQRGLSGFADPDRLAVAVSADANLCLSHAVRSLGLGEGALVPIDVDRNRRMDVGRLRQALKEVKHDRDVFCVVATAGTTAAGSVDPIAGVAEVCEEEDVWLHVDGAYGLAYALVPEKVPLFKGLERADTITWDPHKQMGVPIPNSVLFARTRELFLPMALSRDYWNRADAPGPNPGLKSIPSTRPFSALPLVASIRHQGLDGVVSRLRKPLEAIRSFHDALVGHPDVEVLHEPDTGVLCFRVMQATMSDEELDRLQEQVYRTLQRKGKRMISVTRLGGRAALQAVAVNPEANEGSLMRTLGEALQIAGSFR